ncbi:NUDIX domain-containing protein [Antarcticibacterium sp. 1MA-6-2]|uniref:NUDIX domain-containing protein n=1 Tax=Antarcticibacterium sp. 1MA-6-2 TaxID=2908210 RepID=UPI001F468DA6|nr:NUDIX domain-containing protein [Antarcticibacterium sp. 1MA-6-2]UJH90387.1 NUDIX domain-containing protein [Antarcticibacterium sp. 1MA-6-2]
MKKFIDKLAYIHIREKKILMSLSRGKDTWYIPGGKREAGESDHEALIREIEEELTVKIELETLNYTEFLKHRHTAILKE